MRPLKPYLVALGGLIAAVFSVVFPGAQAGVRLPAPAAAPQSDLQATRLTPVAEVAASRDAQPARKTPAPQPVFPTDDFSPSALFGATPSRDLIFQPRLGARERLCDQRQQLLVGVVELRI